MNLSTKRAIFLLLLLLLLSFRANNWVVKKSGLPFLPGWTVKSETINSTQIQAARTIHGFVIRGFDYSHIQFYVEIYLCTNLGLVTLTLRETCNKDFDPPPYSSDAQGHRGPLTLPYTSMLIEDNRHLISPLWQHYPTL